MIINIDIDLHSLSLYRSLNVYNVNMTFVSYQFFKFRNAPLTQIIKSTLIAHVELYFLVQIIFPPPSPHSPHVIYSHTKKTQNEKWASERHRKKKLE